MDVDKCEEWARDDRIALALDGVAVERLLVGRDPNCDGAVDTLGDDAFAQRERDGEGEAAGEHLAVESLRIVCEKSAAKQCNTDKLAYGGAAVEGRRAEL